MAEKIRTFENGDRRLGAGQRAKLAEYFQSLVSVPKMLPQKPRNSGAFLRRPDIAGLAGLRGWAERIRTRIRRNQSIIPTCAGDSVRRMACAFKWETFVLLGTGRALAKENWTGLHAGTEIPWGGVR